MDFECDIDTSIGFIDTTIDIKPFGFNKNKKLCVDYMFEFLKRFKSIEVFGYKQYPNNRFFSYNILLEKPLFNLGPDKIFGRFNSERLDISVYRLGCKICNHHTSFTYEEYDEIKNIIYKIRNEFKPLNYNEYEGLKGKKFEKWEDPFGWRTFDY